MIDEQSVMNALKHVQDPELKKNLVELGMIRNPIIDKGNITLTLALTTLRCPLKKHMIEEIKHVLGELPGVSSVNVQLTKMSDEERKKIFPRHPLAGIEKVSRTVAVASGKGGVGKTTIAVNIALALQKKGYSVGLLDADVYGPSIPLMLDVFEKPEMENKMLVPVEKFGLKIMSFGMLLKEGQALIWRGPRVAGAIRQLLGDVMWGKLDYLVIDLPPGTGDPSITIAQEIPGMQVLMVTTPQEVALADVRRAVELFNKLKRPVLGFIENMSYFQYAPSTDRLEIFGHGGGQRLSQETGLPLLGAIPLDLEIGRSGDSGVPLMVSAPDSDTASIFISIAGKMEKKL